MNDSAKQEICRIGAFFDSKNWCPATSGNFSLRLEREQIAITRSGVHKGYLKESDILTVNLKGEVLEGQGRPSAETLLHIWAYQRDQATSCVLHGHSVLSTVVSMAYQEQGFLHLESYELLKAFPGVHSHTHSARLAILANSQDMYQLQDELNRIWQQNTDLLPGFLIAGHGLYTWAENSEQALIQSEALETLLDCQLKLAQIKEVQTL